MSKTNFQHLFSVPVVVAALGYFVDIYDLLLFGIVRIPSLQDIPLSEISKAHSLLETKAGDKNFYGKIGIEIG